jgi:peptide/nickel transport system substrate-binding protein
MAGRIPLEKAQLISTANPRHCHPNEDQMKRHLLRLLVAGSLAFGLAAPSWASGTLNVAIGSNLNTLDPNVVRIGEEYVFNGLVYSGLVRFDANGRLQPDLATSWTTSGDLKKWTFQLRHDVKFHSGREMEAEDVVATVNRILDKATGSTARGNLAMVSDVKATGKYSVDFTLSQPYAGFADLFAEHQMRIVPREKIGTLGAQPDGTGPFKFESYTPGDRVVLVKNPNYYQPGEPKLDKVVLRIIPEMAAQVVALRSEDIDLAWNISPEMVSLLKPESSIAIDTVATGSWEGLIMNNNTKPFDDVRVRKAVAAAIDKQALVDAVLLGQGTTTLSPIPSSSPYFNSDIKIGPADPALAKKLLAEAGYPNGFEIALYLPIGRPTRERAGIVASEALRAVGIKVNLQRVPWDQFNKEIEGKAPFYADGFFSRATVDTALYPFYHSSGNWNDGLWHYKNAEVDRLLDQARSTANEEERTKLYKQFQAVIQDDVPSVIAYNLNHTNAVNKKVSGFKSSPMQLLNLASVSNAR